MSLAVWLPLNGNLENQGYSTVQVTNNGATIDNNGKIGKCYYFNGTSTNYMTTTYSTAIGTNDFSIAMWIKIPTLTSGSYYAICTSKTNAAAGAGFGIYWNYSQKKFLWSTADGSGATEIWMANTVDTIVYDKWIHLVMVRNNNDNKKGYFYINGVRYELASVPVIRNITTDTKMNLGRCTNNTYFAKMYLNDFRIYDHALSPLEVKEISQGLVLHYKLDDNYIESTTNLCTSGTLGSNAYNGATGKYSYGTSTDMYKDITVLQGKECTRIRMGTAGQSAYPYVWFDFLHPAQDSYKTLSFDYFPTTQTRVIFYSYNGGANASYTVNGGPVTSGSTIPVILNTWNHITLTLLGTSSATSGWGYMRIGSTNHTSTTTDYWLFANIQIEEKDHATAYTPTFRIGETIIYDSSGYNNNGTIINTPTISSDTSRYSSSINFNGTADGILIENLNISNIINTTVTYSFWIKPNGENGARSVYFGSYSGTSWSIEKTAGNVLRSYWYGSPDETCTGATITDGVWQHICFVKDGTNSIKVYINGVQKWASTATHSNLTFPTTFRIGRDTRSNDGTPYKGLMSDFRIYCTALSAADIQLLYSAGARADNLGGLHVQEFQENNKHSVNKQCILNTTEVLENDTYSNIKFIKNTGTNALNFIEI